MSGCPILVVDDDASIRATVLNILEDEGYRVRVAEHGEEALVLLEAQPARIILLDMRMPVMDGWTFAREARARGYPVRIVVMTAAHDARAWAAEVGAEGMLPKPFNLADLLNEVERLCRAA